MRRAISKEIEDPLSEELLKGRFKDVSVVNVGLSEGAVELTVAPETVLASVN